MKINRKRIIVSLLYVMTVFFISAQADEYVVTNTNDSGNGSLRQAITDANNHAGADNIIFNIPTSDANYDATRGVWVITPSTSLPQITDEGLTIEGGTQATFIGSDTNPYGPEIVIDGSNNTGGYGFNAEARGVAIGEFVINNFSNGIGIFFKNVEGGMIYGCYIGVDATGMNKKPNSVGISLYSHTSNINICSLENKLNIISGNPIVGISLMDTCTNNTIVNNIIGLNRTKTDTLGNGSYGNYGGLYIEAMSDSNNIFDNYVGGNNAAGIYIYQSNWNVIGNNFIGTNNDYTLNLANRYYGVVIASNYTNPKPAEYNQIISNTIGYNKVSGIRIMEAGSIHNTITMNSISFNGTEGGIWLTGSGNEWKTPPVIQSVSSSEVTGTSEPQDVVEVFCDDNNEGRIYLGTVSADASGNFTLPLSQPIPLDNVTATATNLQWNTSYFSNPFNKNTPVEDETVIPEKFSFSQNFPNPFNPSTTLSYYLPAGSEVELTIFNANGKQIKMLEKGMRSAGTHKVRWEGKDGNLNHVPSGIYIARLSCKSEGKKSIIMSRKLMLIK